MTLNIPRKTYVDLFGPTVGDRIRLADTDLIIEALGFEPENLPIMFNKSELSVTQWGTLKINYKTMMTNIEGVFAAGDIVRGGSLVVWGIKDGRDVAENIHNFLLKKEKPLIYVVNENEKEFVHA